MLTISRKYEIIKHTMGKIFVSLDKRIALFLVLTLIAINLIFFLLIKPSISHSNGHNSHDNEADEILFRQDGDTHIDENHIQTEDITDSNEEIDNSNVKESESASQEQIESGTEEAEENSGSDEHDSDEEEQTPPPQPVPFEE